MLFIKEDKKHCLICGDGILKERKIKKGYLHLDGKTFEIKSIPGLFCTTCGETYVREKTKELFENLLRQGLYNPIFVGEIQIYDFKDFEKNPEKFEKETEDYCVFCGRSLEDGLHTIPYEYKDYFIYIKNVSVKKCNYCFEGTILAKELKMALDKFCKEVSKGNIKPIGKTEYIVVKCQ